MRLSIICSWSSRPFQPAEEITADSSHLAEEFAFSRLLNHQDYLAVFGNIKESIVLLGIDYNMIGIGKHLIEESTLGQTIELRTILSEQMHLKECISERHKRYLIRYKVEVG